VERQSSCATLRITAALGLALCGCGGDGAQGTVDADAATDAATAADAQLSSPDAANPEPPWDLRDPLASGAWVRVRNRCPFPLWIHAAGSTGVLQPDDAEIASGAMRDYEAPANWSAARVTAYRDGPRATEIDKAEMTLSASEPLVSLNYNITYVDWVGLPMRIAGAGGECGDEHVVGCFVPVDQLLDGCPSQLVAGQVCQSARSHCLDPSHQSSTYCHALDAEIARCVASVDGCAGYAGATTAEVYACSGALSEEPRLCAALNRGMLDAPDDADESHYYVAEPYNTYARWVHGVCPGIYAFSYDDWLAHGGFRSCRGTELRITFCPEG
jgi:hypothetical protein